ncbi:PAQR family membrane homeostasis protein TrhA [Levilactobacillus zymae]|uniref:Hemolysin III n=1 Tax=Levilactobacillus zymae TaxID=267363 RepID=A0A1Y6JWA6_9LACO|nr:hemolysin III family protein [Levilactobacillus zymae]KRL15599.1 hemolysin III-like protein [Levilactobacillus zymae DSM 19395]QFR60733.1 hemolysin III family protein [Levilactobacillus zymae]GEO70947.1 hemolysin III [Levilactobacillus zymae]SMS14228.1 COG1272: Predicted membrane protein hemolysin III homolog [Levilactobacillus zymae]
MQPPRSRTYNIVNEVLNATTHGIGAGLSIAGLVILLLQAHAKGGALRMTTFAIYGAIMVLFYLASTLFHSLVFTKASHVFQIFDHCAIYLLIAGTYTPYSLLVIGGWLGWTMFGVIWGMAVLGIIYKAIWLGQHQILSTIIYVVMGWMCLLGIKPLYAGLGPVGFGLLFAGGVAFTAGAVLYSFKGVPFGHVIWHLFVMLGTGLMYFSILLYA